MISLHHDLTDLYQKLDFGVYLELTERLIKINKLKIDSELSLQPGLFGYYSGLLTLARKDKAEFEAYIETHGSLLRRNAQRENKTGKKLTVQGLEDIVSGDDLINIKKKLLRNVDAKIGWIKNLVDALDSRQQCLIQLSANSRAEQKLHS